MKLCIWVESQIRKMIYVYSEMSKTKAVDLYRRMEIINYST